MSADNKFTKEKKMRTNCKNETENKINVSDILFDIKSFLKDLYVATVAQDADGVNISFGNGQKFSVCVTENV